MKTFFAWSAHSSNEMTPCSCVRIQAWAKMDGTGAHMTCLLSCFPELWAEELPLMAAAPDSLYRYRSAQLLREIGRRGLNIIVAIIWYRSAQLLREIGRRALNKITNILQLLIIMIENGDCLVLRSLHCKRRQLGKLQCRATNGKDDSGLKNFVMLISESKDIGTKLNLKIQHYRTRGLSCSSPRV